MLTARNLRKTIERKPVLHHIDFSLAPGQVAGLIGRNGSGKTTLLKTLAGILTPDEGEVSCGGMPIHAHPEAKREVVFIPDSPEALYGYTAYGCADLYGMIYPRFDKTFFLEAMKRFGLPVGKNIKHFSKGMKMLLGTALGLATRAGFVLLDEPTNGIDAIAKKQMLTLLMEAAADGTALVISSHMLDELERIADMVLLLKDGTIEVHDRNGDAYPELVKVQVVFRGDAPEEWLSSPRVKVLERVGKVYTLLLGNEAGPRAFLAGAEPQASAYGELEAMEPLLLEPLPLKLEDMFEWKLGGPTNAR
ncbi:ABC transporter ATP-binding protein [Cohnella massiliensis]|uniref:ABC transporter ATP-binding protein n=1 Tax=Cohnella massiliensis TaxID=1816691 RepID=UPI0009B96318|nr:ABC transporter ATP-binding protein [Cohnella massiliensis]